METVETVVKLLTGKYRHYKIIVTPIEEFQTEFSAAKVVPYVSAPMFQGYKWNIIEHPIKREIRLTVLHHVIKQENWRDVPGKGLKPKTDGQ